MRFGLSVMLDSPFAQALDAEATKNNFLRNAVAMMPRDRRMMAKKKCMAQVVGLKLVARLGSDAAERRPNESGVDVCSSRPNHGGGPDDDMREI